MKMTNFEKAVRYICLFSTEDEATMVERYKAVDAIVNNDEEVLQRYVKKYEKMLDLLSC